jgi:lipopolysaccharide assembly protein B
MEANVWWLVAVPVLFGLGWLAARLDAAQLFTQTRQMPASYFKGLNYLLNDQHEQAIASFEEVARLDPETAELYFALGNLFRRRGETERAIRIHRNLLERADLPESQRQQALFCVAQDYLNAGIFDRAEAGFSALANTPYAAQSQRELAKLFEKEHNWPAAIQSVQAYLSQVQTRTFTKNPSQNQSHSHNQNQNQSSRSSPLETIDLQAQAPAADTVAAQEDLSHYACELALSQLGSPQAAQSLALAQQAHPNNPRIAFVQAHIHLAQHDTAAAMACLTPVIQAQPTLTALAIQTVLQSRQTASAAIAPADLNTLLAWAQQHPSADSIKPLLPLLRAQGELTSSTKEVTLLQALAAQLKQAPQRLATANLLLRNAEAHPEHSQQWHEQALSAMDALTARYDKPTCSHCGFKASRHQWRCAGCGRWNTLPYTS